ncbi:MAG: hypothetical protein HYU39_06115 [Thaumarchaeota archaeon]|nr:hypothetical protein [Nitrososphaerota archaeon]
MKYMVDGNTHGLAKGLRKAVTDCKTDTEMIRGDDDQRIGISDARILKFLLSRKGALTPLSSNTDEITLITSDTDFAEYCQEFGIPYIKEENPETKNFEEIAERVTEKLRGASTPPE